MCRNMVGSQQPQFVQLAWSVLFQEHIKKEDLFGI